MRSLMHNFGWGLIALTMLPLVAMGAWEPQNSGTTTSLYGISALNSQTAVAVGPYGTILRTENGGGLWLSVTSGVVSSLMATYFLDENLGWACGANGVILVSTDGGQSWNPQPSGFTQYLYSIHFIDSLNGWACGWDGEILNTSNGGTSWEVQPSGVSDILFSIRFVNDLIGWAVGAEGTILATTDGGTSWDPQASGTIWSLESVFCIDENTAWTVGSHGTILKTTNGGTDWVLCNSCTQNPLKQIYFSDVDHGWIVDYHAAIQATTDGGENWHEQYTGSISIDLRGVSMVDNLVGWICGTSGTILYTNDGGIAFPIEITLTPTNPPIVIPPTGGFFDFEIMIVNYTDSLVTYDAWTDVVMPSGEIYPLINREGLVITAEDTLARDLTQMVPEQAPYGYYSYRGHVGEYPSEIWDLDYFIFAKSFTRGGEGWSGDWLISGDLLDEGHESKPATFVLGQNYPNPFNPVTTIRYGLPEDAFVKLAIYDLLGRQVAVLVDGQRQAGLHEVSFDACQLASGLYIYCIEASDFIAVRKMILMK